MLDQVPDRKWTIYLIHHSHTDIGYTEHQKRIELYHVQYLKQALEIYRQVKSGVRPEWKEFKWTSECFWSIERFLEVASKEEAAELADAIRDGFIGLNANYLHNNELLSFDIMSKTIARGVNYGKSLGVIADSGMAADINGFGWGFAQALADNDVKHFLTCIHSHKGMAPTGQRQNAFWWESTTGKKVLIWNGEHYHLGNILGLAPKGYGTYRYRDDVNPSMARNDVFPLTEIRLSRYLRRLELDGYPYDFAPLAVSGLFTDNAPPSIEILELIHRWNATYQDKIQIEMVTVGEFFSKIKNNLGDIPTYRGDWPDWWSDGVGSVPPITRIYRAAQRQLQQLEEVSRQYHVDLDPKKVGETEWNLAMYAEHTFNHSESQTQPWDLQVHALGGRKHGHAQNAYDKVVELWNDAQEQLGESQMQTVRPLRYKVINPTAQSVTGCADLYLDHTDCDVINTKGGGSVIDVQSGKIVSHQQVFMLRGLGFRIQVSLNPGESRVYEILKTPMAQSIRDGDYNDDVRGDILWKGQEKTSAFESGSDFIQSEFVRIAWKVGEGIVSWKDLKSGRELLRGDRDHPAFTPVYEKTPSLQKNDSAALQESRRLFGRNRKGVNVERSAGELVSSQVVCEGPLYALVELAYRVPGMPLYKLQLTVYSGTPRVTARILIHKESVWEAENVYVSLPFSFGEGKGDLWISKQGADFRPWIDQIPGTLTDFYCIGEGFSVSNEEGGVAISTPDAPLLQLGPIEHGKRLLHGHPDLSAQKMLPYGWVMNNSWETNFNVNLGGFHEFNYEVEWGTALRDPKKALDSARVNAGGVRAFRCV